MTGGGAEESSGKAATETGAVPVRDAFSPKTRRKGWNGVCRLISARERRVPKNVSMTSLFPRAGGEGLSMIYRVARGRLQNRFVISNGGMSIRDTYSGCEGI